MMTKPKSTLPESQGKFRRDLYEKVSKIVQDRGDRRSPYRAFGEVTAGRWEDARDIGMTGTPVRR